MTNTKESPKPIDPQASKDHSQQREIERFYTKLRREIVSAATAAFVAGSRMSRLSNEDGLGIALKDIPSLPFNRWVGLGIDRPASEQSVAQVVDWMTANANDLWSIDITPAALPLSLRIWLEDRGFRAVPGGFATFWRDAAPMRQACKTRFTVRRIELGDADLSGTVAISGFEMPHNFGSWMSSLVGRPGWHIYIAFQDSVPAGSAAMFIESGMAWLGIDSTVPAFRQQGLQNALLAQRIQDASSFEAKLLTIETVHPQQADSPDASYRNVLRAGFKLSHIRRHYVRKIGRPIVFPDCAGEPISPGQG